MLSSDCAKNCNAYLIRFTFSCVSMCLSKLKQAFSSTPPPFPAYVNMGKWYCKSAMSRLIVCTHTPSSSEILQIVVLPHRKSKLSNSICLSYFLLIYRNVCKADCGSFNVCQSVSSLTKPQSSFIKPLNRVLNISSV